MKSKWVWSEITNCRPTRSTVRKSFWTFSVTRNQKDNKSKATFQGGTSFVHLLCFCSVLCLLCLCVRLFICALWSPTGNGLTSWLSFVVCNCEFVTLPLVSWVRCGTWLYRFLIFAPLLTFLSLPRQDGCKTRKGHKVIHTKTKPSTEPQTMGGT